MVSPEEKNLQSYVSWYDRTLGPPLYADLAKEALAEARVQIRDVFGSSARLMEADITAMLISFEQAALAAVSHLDSAASMRDRKLEDASYLGGEESAEQKIREADDQLAFTTSMVVESVVSSAMKPKAWLEDQLHRREDESPFEYLQVSNPTR